MKSRRNSKVCAKIPILLPRYLNEIYKTGRIDKCTDVRCKKKLFMRENYDECERRRYQKQFLIFHSYARRKLKTIIVFTLAFIMTHVNRVIFMIVW